MRPLALLLLIGSNNVEGCGGGKEIQFVGIQLVIFRIDGASVEVRKVGAVSTPIIQCVGQNQGVTAAASGHLFRRVGSAGNLVERRDSERSRRIESILFHAGSCREGVLPSADQATTA